MAITMDDPQFCTTLQHRFTKAHFHASPAEIEAIIRSITKMPTVIGKTQGLYQAAGLFSWQGEVSWLRQGNIDWKPKRSQHSPQNKISSNSSFIRS